MDNVWIELIRQIPGAMAVIFVVKLFLDTEEKREVRRDANAKEIAKENREHQLAMNSVYANSFKSLTEEIAKGQKMIADALKEHELASRERYDRMGITKDLYDAAKESLKK